MAGQVFDLVEQYGTAAQQERVSSEAFLELLYPSCAVCRNRTKTPLCRGVRRCTFLFAQRIYQKLAEAYAFRAECNEKAARYNDAVYDLAAAIQIVERYWESPDRENALVDLYLKRGRIYLSFRKLNSAAEDNEPFFSFIVFAIFSPNPARSFFAGVPTKTALFRESACFWQYNRATNDPILCPTSVTGRFGKPFGPVA